MLVLSRREGEGITLTLEDGRKIYISHVAYRQGEVRLGIDAPKTINIARTEVDDGRNAWKEGGFDG